MRVAAKILSAKNVRGVLQSTSGCPSKSFSTQVESFTWPREREGNIYIDNWSLTEDGVVPVGDLYRNARLPIVTTRLPVKVEGGKINLDSPKYTGAYNSLEAGDGIDHEAFSDILAAQQLHLSGGKDLFAEDAYMGTHASGRVGMRVITDSPAALLILRTLLMPSPPRPTDHRARYNGWNYDERWAVLQPVWNGSNYDIVQEPTASIKGERPVVLFYGGPGDACAFQFVEQRDSIVGANVSVGGAVPIRGLIAALGQASAVLINTMYDDCIAIASVSITQGKETRVIIGCDDSVVDAAVAKNILFGAYDNILSVRGVAPMWNGAISATSKAGPIPSVVVDGMTAALVEPNNLAHPATSIVFFEKGAKKSTLTEEEAVAKLVGLSEESRAAVAADIVKGVKCTVVGTAAEAIAM